LSYCRPKHQVQAALAAISARAPEGLIVLTLSVYAQRPAQAAIRAFVAQHKIPAIYGDRSWVVVGGLMSYAPKSDAVFERIAVYVEKILRGAHPVEQPTLFDFAVNSSAARQLGVTFPPHAAALISSRREVLN
jgi:putative tryptophan/tyrosine transport system substrate-binding protein